MDEFVLRTSYLSKSYGKHCAINDICISIPKGAIYGLIGRNGAGKTTLLKVVSGLHHSTSGDYSIFDIPCSDKRIFNARRNMRAVWDIPTLYEGMTAIDNLREQYRLLGMHQCHSSICELISTVGLDPLSSQKVKFFSFGMKQRLSIAMALVGSPEFIILDEPTNGLDPQGIAELRDLILLLNQSHNITFLISSHILSEMEKIATHYGILEKGKLIKEISSAELYPILRRSIVVTVANPLPLIEFLRKKGLNFQILSDNKIEVIDQLPTSALLGISQEAGCPVLAIYEKKESIEEFFLRTLQEYLQ